MSPYGDTITISGSDTRNMNNKHVHSSHMTFYDICV